MVRPLAKDCRYSDGLMVQCRRVEGFLTPEYPLKFETILDKLPYFDELAFRVYNPVFGHAKSLVAFEFLILVISSRTW